MRIVVDFDSCAAMGECTAQAPGIFDLGADDDVVTVLLEEPPEELRGPAQAAAEACPMAAIQIVD